MNQIIRPLGNRVLIQGEAAKTETDGGIKLPGADKKKPEAGWVVSVGPGERLKNGKLKRSDVEPGEHVLFTDSGYEPVLSGHVQTSFIDGTHIFAKSVDTYPIFDFNGYNIGFDHVALRDTVFILPSEPSQTLGEKGVIQCVDKHRKKHHDKTGLLLSAGPGFLSDEDGKFHPTDPRLKSGLIVKFDLTVPWRTFVRDTKGKKHYVCICGSMDIYGLWDSIELMYLHTPDQGEE